MGPNKCSRSVVIALAAVAVAISFVVMGGATVVVVGHATVVTGCSNDVLVRNNRIASSRGGQQLDEEQKRNITLVHRNITRCHKTHVILY